MWFWFVMVCICLIGQQAWAGAEIAISPEVVVMPETVVGDSVHSDVWVKNVGDRQLAVLDLSFAQGRRSEFRAAPARFDLGSGDSISVRILFRPRSGGSHIDALQFQAEGLTTTPSHPLPVVAVTARVLSPEIAVSASRLVFASSGIGKRVSESLKISNLGSAALQVSGVSVGDNRFAVEPNVFQVDASGSRFVTVSYTPDSSRARTDSLIIRSNDDDESRVPILLEAFGTPRGEARARLSLTVLKPVSFPSVGDTVSVDVMLSTNQDSVGGIEIYVGYNPIFFRSVRPDSPYVRKGLTRDSLQILKNTIVSVEPDRRVVYLSAVTPVPGRRVLDGVVGHLDFVVISPLVGQTRLRTLTDVTRLNSIFSTPGGRVFTLPGSGGVVFGNTPPGFRKLPLIQMQEDKVTNLRLSTVGNDSESVVTELSWQFTSPDHLVETALITENNERKIQFRPPLNGWGTYPVTAVITDPGGLSDTTAIVLQVTAVNDPPDMPILRTPADRAVDLGSPVSFVWQGSDVDWGDVLTFNFRMGTDSLSLTTVQSGIRDSAFVVQELEVGKTYFWQIGARDKGGLITRSLVRRFTMAGTPDMGFTNIGDIDGDLLVGFSDFIRFVQVFGKTSSQPDFVTRADLDQDGLIGFVDFIIFATLFGTNYSSS